MEPLARSSTSEPTSASERGAIRRADSSRPSSEAAASSTSAAIRCRSCRLIAGLTEDKPFAEPTSIRATGILGPTGVDEHAAALLTFASGLTAEATCAVRYGVGTQTIVFGEEGKIFLPDPWLPGGKRQALESGFTIVRDGKDPETVTVKTEKPTYAIEAEVVADAIPNTEAAWPAMTWADSIGNMKAIDAWRAAITHR